MEKFQINSNRTKNKIRTEVAIRGFPIEKADCGLEYAKQQNPISFDHCLALVMARIYYMRDTEFDRES